MRISYCIPILDRADDLLETLKPNLSENQAFVGNVEFVVAIFDEDDTLLNRLTVTFSEEIASRYLRVHKVAGLKNWHFGKAKNAFGSLIKSDFYSSLDADNFVTSAETLQTLQLIDQFDGYCIIHHFRGDWGDGTCGRITLPRHLYTGIGYDAVFMPRQYDDIDLILSSVCRNRDIVYVSYFKGGALAKGSATKRFLSAEGISVRNIVVSPPDHVAPLNPRGGGYVTQTPKFSLMLKFNQNTSFARNCSEAVTREDYLNAVTEIANRLVDLCSAETLSGLFFDLSDLPSGQERIAASCIPVLSIMRDEDAFLTEWYVHYRDIGASQFLIIDDGSQIAVKERIPFDDVQTVKPFVGTYRTCRTAWLRTLMKVYLSEGQWVITVDADEFLSLPSEFSGDIVNVINKAEEKDQDMVSALLVDMLPTPATIDLMRNGRLKSVIKSFPNNFWKPNGLLVPYALHPAIQWGFGLYWRLSARVDVRNYLFGTVNSLRKIPIFRYRADVRLNQGNHDLKYSGQSGFSPSELWRSGFMLALRHYKLARLFLPGGSETLERKSRKTGVYHPRTTRNMERMMDYDPVAAVASIDPALSIPFNADRVTQIIRPTWTERKVYKAWRKLRRLARKFRSD